MEKRGSDGGKGKKIDGGVKIEEMGRKRMKREEIVGRSRRWWERKRR